MTNFTAGAIREIIRQLVLDGIAETSAGETNFTAVAERQTIRILDAMASHYMKFGATIVTMDKQTNPYQGEQEPEREYLTWNERELPPEIARPTRRLPQSRPSGQPARSPTEGTGAGACPGG